MAAAARFVWRNATVRNAILLALAYNAGAALRRRLRHHSVKGQVIVITGGANGIGRDAAFAFARRGAVVAIWDIDAAALEATKADVEAGVPGCKIMAYRVDMSRREAVYAAAKRVQADLGFVYCVVNNCGIVSGDVLLNIPDHKIVRTFAVNTLAIVWTTKAFLPAMLERNCGHIATVSSAASYFPSPKMADYAASKFASRGLMEGLRVELNRLGASGVHTSCLCPGHVKTKLFKGFSYLLPSLEPTYVAERIVQAVEKRDELVIMPWYLIFAVIGQTVMPNWLLDLANRLGGASGAMEKFSGARARQVFDMMDSDSAGPAAAPAARATAAAGRDAAVDGPAETAPGASAATGGDTSRVTA